MEVNITDQAAAIFIPSAGVRLGLDAHESNCVAV
jgi:hypothetical protein